MNHKRKYSIGRGSDNDIVINHETVSRKHAEMTIDIDRIVIADFNSKNGTYVIRNDNPVQIRIVEVKEDDTVVFGDVVMKVSELLSMASRVISAGDMTPSKGIRPHEAQSIPRYEPSPIQNNINSVEIEYAGFWSRLAAYFIDTMILLIINLVLILFYSFGLESTKGNQPFWGTISVIIIIFDIGYTLFFWFYKQATPGKMVLSIKIVDAKTGGIPSAGQFVGRYFAYILSTLPLFLGYIWIAFSKKKQGWHDMLAGTVVIKLKKKVPVRFE